VKDGWSEATSAYRPPLKLTAFCSSLRSSPPLAPHRRSLLTTARSSQGTSHYPWPQVPTNAAVAAAAVLWKRSYLTSSTSPSSPHNQRHPNTEIPLLSSPDDLLRYAHTIFTRGTDNEKSNIVLFLSTLLSELNSTQKVRRSDGLVEGCAEGCSVPPL